MDDPIYSLFSSLTGDTFRELSVRTGVPLSLLMTARGLHAGPMIFQEGHYDGAPGSERGLTMTL